MIYIRKGLIFFFLFYSFLVYSGNRKKILVLHSYYQGLRWTDNVNLGIQSVLDSVGNKYDVDYEYLDTKRNPSPEYLEKLTELYELKLSKQKYDVIIVSDNNALSFVKKHGEKYFGQSPIVFCGINHFKDEMIDGMSNVTGIAEEVDWDGVIGLILTTRPNTRHLVVINDDKTTTAKLNKLLMLDLEKKYNKQIEFIYYEDQTLDELVGNVEKIRGDTSILLLTFNKDKHGNFISYQDNLENIIPVAKVPIYIAWAFYISDGVIGGKIVKGSYHGEMAARFAIKILNGVSPDSIAVYRKPLDQYIVNYNEIQRFNIDKNHLPKETFLRNAPKSFYSENKEWIHIVFGIVSLSTVIILVLARAIIRRIRAEKALIKEQERLKVAVKHERLLGIIGRLLNASADFKNVLDDVLKLMTDELNVARISMYSLHSDDDSAVKIRSRISTKGKNIKDVDQFYFTELKDIIERLQMNKSIVSNDLSNLGDKEREYYRKRNIKSVVILPVVVENKLVGLMGFSQNKQYNWTNDEISIFSSTVNMISNAWERNSLMEARIEAEQKNVEAMRLLEESSKMASIGVMAAGITHEINQPLNAIKITADSVLFWQKRHPDELPEMFTRKIKTISEGTERIDSIIKHMRKFWEKPLETSSESVNMHSAVMSALSLVKRQVYDHSIELITDLSDEEIKVHSNQVQFEQIIVNLVVNSIHSLDHVKKDKKWIRILLTKDVNHGIFEIHDNGTGIDEGIRDKIYDPLFTTKEPELGSGLGMAIVKSFIDRFNGEISNYNNADGGASFVVKFRLQQ